MLYMHECMRVYYINIEVYIYWIGLKKCYIYIYDLIKYLKYSFVFFFTLKI